jgi:hypothetical protein
MSTTAPPQVAAPLSVPSTKDVPKEEKTRGQPAFLDKTYSMVEQCNAEDTLIAEWSLDGKSFTVKDPVKFAETYIPKFFKHSNFSSFVRQMNFYGFRKVKVGEGANGDGKQSSWQFRHPKFQRGQKHLLADIKRRTYADSNVASQTDVDELKEEIKTLRETVHQYASTMIEMQSIIQRLERSVPMATGHPAENRSRKRPRIVSDVHSGTGSLKMKCVVKTEGQVSPSKRASTPFKFEDTFSAPVNAPILDASVEWGDVFNDSFAMDASPLPMELGSPAVSRSCEPMDQALVSTMIETLVTNVTESAIAADAPVAPDASHESPEASPRSCPTASPPRADGGMSPMNTTSDPLSAASVTPMNQTAVRPSGTPEPQRRLATKPDQKLTPRPSATSSASSSSSSSASERAAMKRNLEPLALDESSTSTGTRARGRARASKAMVKVKQEPREPKAPITQLLPIDHVASQLVPQVSQQQQVALLSCMLQHFAAAVPKTLLQMQENYGMLETSDERASWSGKSHPLRHNPISSEVA